MKRILWLIPLALLCAGCPRTYIHASRNSIDFERDYATCERISRQKLAKKGVT